jgi:hypothetical protein
MSKEDRITAKRAELKTQHSDWDNAKLDKTAGMLVGREIKNEEAKVLREAHEKELGDAISKENPGIDEKDLAKKVKQAVAKEESDVKKAEADKDVAEKYTALFDSITARAKLDDTKQDNSIPKDVRDAIAKIQKLTI